MNNFASIYDNSYEGETYSLGVAYLREEPIDHDPDNYESEYPTLDRQRRIIEKLAITARTLVIAEFIDYCGMTPAAGRPGLNRLRSFCQDTQPSIMLTASEDVLALNTHDGFTLRYELEHGSRCTVISGDEPSN